MSGGQSLDGIKTMVNDYLDKKNQYINSENEKVQNIFNDLSNKTIGQIDGLKAQVDSQNDAIQKQISKNKRNSNDSKHVKSQYQQIEIDKLKYQNFILYLIFYLLVLVLGVVMLYSTSFSIVFQVIVLLVMLAYPFIIYYIELFVYYVYKYLSALFSSTKFSNIYIGDY